jgi:hypothetical protein
VRISRYCLIVLIPLCFAACQRVASQAAPAATAAPATPFLVHASIRELMDAEIDPAADALWGSVAIINGVEKRPQTPEEWQALRRSAITLIEATNLIVMDGRRIAPAGSRYRDEPDTQVLQARFNANRAAFVGMAEALRAVSLKTLTAIDAQDANRLFELGGDLDETCEACHVVYWYPPDLETKR